MKHCPLVFVEWEDSRQSDGAWHRLSELPRPVVVLCVTVGWLLRDGKVLMIAPNMGDLDDETNVQASGIIQIPRRCVVRVRKLKEPSRHQRP